MQGQVGSGAYSKVYRAEEKLTKTLYAVKVTRKILVLHKKCISYLKKELAIMKSIESE